MFEQEYRTANNRIHAGDDLLARIRAKQDRKTVPARGVWWAAGGTAVAAAAVLIAVLAVPKWRALNEPDMAKMMVADGFSATEEVAAGSAETYACESMPQNEEAYTDSEMMMDAGAVLTANEDYFMYRYEDVTCFCAMDDWFICRLDESTVAAACETDGAWQSATFTLSYPTHTLLTDDDELIALSDTDEGTRISLYTLSEDLSPALSYQFSTIHPGAYVDAIHEDGTVFLLTETDAGLCLVAQDLSSPDAWSVMQQLPYTGDGASLFEANDGVLLSCCTESGCLLSVLLSEPDGFVIDAEQEFSGSLIYAYYTRNGKWHATFFVDGSIVERTLDDSLATVSEHLSAFTADQLYFDDEELLLFTQTDESGMASVERWLADANDFYVTTGEVWPVDADVYTGELVSWDDDTELMYLFLNGRLYTCNIQTGEMSLIAEWILP